MPTAAKAVRAAPKSYTVWADIVKTEETPEGHLMVFGKATGTGLDGDGQRMSAKFLAKAMPEWMEWGNLREQHSKIAAGVGQELTQDGDSWMLKSLCVDEGTKEKIRTKVLKGYSINVLDARVTKGTARAPGGEIVAGTIGEISYVDRPCLGDATISICKAAGSTLAPVDAAGMIVVEPAPDVAAETWVDDETTDDDSAFVSPVALADDETAVVPPVVEPPKPSKPDAPKSAATPTADAELVGIVKALATSLSTLAGEVASLKKSKGAKKAKTTTVPSLEKTAATVVAPNTTDVSKAVAEATADLKTELASVKTALAKVMATPLPGAPVIMGSPARPRSNATASRRAEYLAKASASNVDPDVAESFRILARLEPAGD